MTPAAQPTHPGLGLLVLAALVLLLAGHPAAALPVREPLLLSSSSKYIDLRSLEHQERYSCVLKTRIMGLGPHPAHVTGPAGRLKQESIRVFELGRGGNASDQQYYPDSPLRLFFTEPGLAPLGGAKTFQVWDPYTMNPLQDLDSGNGLVTDYVMGHHIDEPLARIAGGSTHVFLGDQLMSVRGLVDAAGVQVNQYTYAAFGAGRSQTETVASRLRFTGRELDLATGLHFVRDRHYLSSLGRWSQPDRMGFVDGPNRYAYVLNNPTNLVDPSGRQIQFSIFIPGIGWVIALGTGIVLVNGIPQPIKDYRNKIAGEIAEHNTICLELDRQRRAKCKILAPYETEVIDPCTGAKTYVWEMRYAGLYKTQKECEEASAKALEKCFALPWRLWILKILLGL